MESITYLNIQVEGVPHTKLLGLEIKHAVNEHGEADISCEMESEAAQNYIKRVDEKTMIRILTTAEGQPSVLFCGVVKSAGIQMMSEYAVVQLSLKSVSTLLDQEKKNKSFQNTAKTYEQIMTQAVAGQASINMQVTDRAIGNMIIQCNETNWEFCKRMASRLSAPLITSIDGKVPVLTVGIPIGGRQHEIKTTESYADSQKTAGEGRPVFAGGGTSLQTRQYVFLGDTVSNGGGNLKVSGIHATLAKGILISTIYIAGENQLKQTETANVQISGKMYTGEVKDVQKDTVKVHLIDIDSEYDGDSTVWLPYSTAYSSGDGSGFYCMPAKGDLVRVFFPGSDEGQAFAASSVSVSPGADVTDKQWTGPNGKQILMTKEGIYITTNINDNKIFINLTDDEGITIVSNKNINICAKNNLSLISNNSISVTAEKDILISTAESYIDIKPEGIELGAENVVIK